MILLLLAFENTTVLHHETTHVPGAGSVEFTLFQAEQAPTGWPEDPGNGRWLVLKSRHGTWVVPGYGAHDLQRHEPGLALFTEGMTGFGAQRRLGFVDGDLVIVNEGWADRYSATQLDWELRHGRWEDRLGDEAWEGALLMARPWAYSPVQVPTWTVRGDCDGDADASLQVAAHARPEALDLRLRVFDDEEIAPSDISDEALVAADHVEVWLDGGRLLGVSLEDEPTARWLQGSGEVPEVRWDVDVLVIELPWGSLGEGTHQAGELVGSSTEWTHPVGASWPMTVVFSDADGSGQETRVATSTLDEPGKKLGRLFVLDGAERFPRPPGAERR